MQQRAHQPEPEVPAGPEHQRTGDRLREVEQQCANDYAKMGATECNAASEARHRLFMGNGKPAYTPSKETPRF